MSNVSIREPKIEDKENFLAVMQRSQVLHCPWVKAPLTSQEFDEYFQRFQYPNQKSFLVWDESNNIAGVCNVSEIVRGLFQNAFLGFYAVADHANKGHMSAGLKLVNVNFFARTSWHKQECN